ncbi:hypothetical protein PSPTOT1_3370 [Pseudomonas syringae pv. tomato T1]|nr:hypothetical protein PSPTOT1_3370 [Pseudomonas syringae pv. tomato T1]
MAAALLDAENEKTRSRSESGTGLKIQTQFDLNPNGSSDLMGRRMTPGLLPFALQRLQRVFHERAISRGFLANITLTATEHLQSSAHLRVSVTELTFLSEWRHGVDMNFTRIGNPYNVVVQRILARGKQTSQFSNSRLFVDIHVDAPSLVGCSIIDTSSSHARRLSTQHD